MSLALSRHLREAIGRVEDEPLVSGGYDAMCLALASRVLLGGPPSVMVNRYTRPQSLAAALNSKYRL